jgi:hypothetical protein
MNKKQNRMIYLADNQLVTKIQVLREKHQLNVSAFIRNCLESKYQELEKSEHDTSKKKMAKEKQS